MPRVAPVDPQPRDLARSPRVLPVLALALAASVAVAGEPAAENARDRPEPVFDETVTVTAERVPVPLAETGTSVTVLDREEIERRNVSFATDLLETVAGVDVVRSGGFGTVATVFVRGGAGVHALVLVDGVRVNSATDGGFDFSSLRVHDIERVEILRGPQSVLYGSEAMSGVIAFTTRAGADALRVDGAVRAGSESTYEGALSAATTLGRWSVSAALSAFETDSVSAASESAGNGETDPYDDVAMSARVGYALDGGDAFALTARGTRATVGLDGFGLGGPEDDPNFLQDRSTYQTAVRWSGATRGRFTPSVTVGASSDRYEGRDPDSEFNNYDFRGRVLSADVQSDVDLRTAGSLLIGAGYESRNGENRGSFDESATLASGFVQHRRAWGERWFLTAGARHERHSEFGGATTWRAAVSWNASARTRVHGSLATGFRAPSLNELYFPFLGVPTLDPERSRGGDLGVEGTFADGAVVVDVTLFRTTFDDLIQYDFGSFTFANIGSAEARGVEATVTAAAGRRVDLRAAWTWQDTENGDTGDPLARRPRNRASVTALADLGTRWSGRATVVAVRDRVESDGQEMDDYTRLDLAVEYDAGAFRPFVRIDNATDEDYEEIPGYTTPGVAFSIGARFGFGGGAR